MKHNKWVILGTLFLVLAVLVGCAPARAPSKVASQLTVERDAGKAAATPPAASAQPVAENASSAYGGGASGSADQQASVGERMIISTVDMSVVVEDTDKAFGQLQALTNEYKGYVSDSRRWYEGEQPLANVTIRVPAASLSEALAKIRALAIRVESENTSGQDVTEEYTDVQARLRNLETTEKELLLLETQVRESRGKAEDILAVHREITDIRGQIESLQGRQQYLERMTALATIHLTIRPKALPQPLIQSETWNPLITVNRALRNFVSVVQVLIDIAINVLVFSPIILVPLLVLWLLVRLLRRGKKSKKDTSAPKNP